ncbi:MAG: transposase [Acidobacteria bacterium]|nr:transposase [Acidobacteriota bacterium]
MRQRALYMDCRSEMDFRQRRLPHAHAIGVPMFITFRLHGSLPQGRYFGPKTKDSGAAFALVDRFLDEARCGPTHLRTPQIAELVAREIERADGFELHNWVIMSNHVHMLMTPRETASRIMQRVKGRTAVEANRILGIAGPFWQHESFDRLVLNRTEFRRVARYIEGSPVKAGVVNDPSDFRRSSAWGGLKSAPS